jgi:hypothetical protein
MTVEVVAKSASGRSGGERVNLLRERNDKDVYDKYEILSSIGQGSMVRRGWD